MHSNSIGNIDSLLQMQSLFRVIGNEEDSYRAFFMNYDIKLTSESSLKEVSSYAFNNIKEYNPDYIVIFGDIAFKYALPLINNIAPVYFSNVSHRNKPFLKDLTLGGVVTEYKLELFKEYLFSSYTALWKITLLYDPSPESRFVLEEIIKEFKRLGITSYEISEIISYNELTRKIIALNKNRGIVISCIRKLSKQAIIMNNLEVLRVIKTLNTNMLEVGTQKYCSNPAIGIAIGVGIDYTKMGSTLGEILLSNKPKILVSNTTLSVNLQRLSELGFIETYKKSNKLFESIYSNYE